MTIDLAPVPRRGAGRRRRAAARRPARPGRRPREPRRRHARGDPRRRRASSRRSAARADPVCTDPVPPLYDFLAGIERVRTDPDPGGDYDLLVVSDCGTLDRIGEVRDRHAELFERLPRVVIDHHASNDAAGEADWIEPDAAATCEMVALLAARLGVPLDAADGALAAALMAGIVMDTATFAHPTRRRGRWPCPAALVEAGAPLSDISRRLYRSKPDGAAPAVRAGARSARRAPTAAASSGRPCSTPTSPRPARSPPQSEGIIDLLAQADEAEVAILFKEAGQATRISVRTKPGGVDATVLTGRSVAAGTPGRPGRPSSSPSTRHGRRSSPRRTASPPRSRADRGAHVPRARASTASSSSTSRSARPRTTSSASSAGWPRPSASATAGRSTRSHRACCRCSSAAATRVVEFHLADRKALPRDGLLRRVVDDRRPRGRADARVQGRRPTREPTSRRRWPGFTGPISQRPPAYSAIKVGGRRAYAMARAGETVDAGRAAGHDPRAVDLVAWDGRDPDRPIAVLDVALLGRARTSGRSPATSASALGSGAYLGALRRTGAGPFRGRRRDPLDAVRAAAADGPGRARPRCCCRSTPASTASRTSS